MRRRSELLTRLIVLGVWGTTIGTLFVWSVGGDKSRTAIGDAAQLSQAAELTRIICFGMTVLLCLLVIGVDRRPRNTQGFSLMVVCLLPWAYFALRGLADGTLPGGTSLLYPMLVVAFWLLKPSIEQLGFVGILVAVTVVAGVVIALVMPRAGLGLDYLGEILEADKDFFAIGLITGVFTSANNFGQFVVLGLPLMLLIPWRAVRYASVAVSLFVLVWTASRGALLAAGLVIAVYIGLTLTRGKARTLLAALAVISCAAVAVLAPIISRDPNAFSGRGRIWAGSFTGWLDAPWFGNGPGWYSYLGTKSSPLGTDAIHAHNQFVHALTTGGVVGLVFVSVLVWMLWRAASAQLETTLVPLLFLVALLGTSVLEVSIGFVDRTNFLLVVAVPILMIVFSHERFTSKPLAELR